MKFSERDGNGPMNKWLNFGGDPDRCPATGIVFRIRHYLKIQKVVNGHKAAGTISCSYRRGTARRAVSVKICQLVQNCTTMTNRI